MTLRSSTPPERANRPVASTSHGARPAERPTGVWSIERVPVVVALVRQHGELRLAVGARSFSTPLLHIGRPQLRVPVWARLVVDVLEVLAVKHLSLGSLGGVDLMIQPEPPEQDGAAATATRLAVARELNRVWLLELPDEEIRRCCRLAGME